MEAFERNARQRDLVPQESLNNTSVIVIGVGAIGRQVATLLACMGAQRITIVDPDIVGTENLAVQGYMPADVGKLKVNVMKGVLEAYNPGNIHVQALNEKYKKYCDPLRQEGDQLAVFCCVDSIADRKFIWRALANGPFTRDFDLLVDGRMAAEVLKVLTWKKGTSTKGYEISLHDPSESYQAPCTGRTTLYTSYTIAGMMVGEFAKWLRNQILTTEQMYNMLSSDFTVVEPEVACDLI